MRNLSSLILALLWSVGLFSQSPHGDKLKISCSDCHNPSGWKLDLKTITFKHSSTNFLLEGQHKSLYCTQCHTSLIFSDASSECISCHTDVHYQTVGPECSRCHTSNSWIVQNISEIHRESRFPLLGAHATAACSQCHPSESLLRFEPLGIECFDCHEADYNKTTDPNHGLSNFSTNCIECHLLNAFSWTGASFNHAFFPLTEGHAINDCNKCHTNGNFSNTSRECISCHQTDYNSTTNPNHLVADFSTNCTECHTTHPGWKPADFKQHDGLYFPIYSGKHNGTWDNCTQCHEDPSNYSMFTCISCHEHNQGSTDNQHNEVGGYQYNSQACFECHPTGSAENGFNHNLTNFPLTGAHITTACNECHTNGFAGTTTICGDCHLTAYNQTLNPNHVQIGISNDCASCHTTQPGWKPATFAVHNDFYPLTGAHASIANDCATCHNDDYVNTPAVCSGCHINEYNQSTNPNHISIGIPNDCETCHTTIPGWKPALFPIHNNYYVLAGAHANIAGDCASCHTGDYSTAPTTCFGCHENNYNQTNNPPHAQAQFSTDCESCHSQNAWVPSTYDHDGQYFPIYSGKHFGQWNLCTDCHTNQSNYGIFSCIDCHEHLQPVTDQEHGEVGGYTYNSIACYECHPTGQAGGAFDHNNSNFPLTGAHLTTDCILCHANGYAGTTTICSDCHIDAFNQTTNPNHASIGIPQECATCHTTVPGWQPAIFPIHNNYYVLEGAHVPIANNCDVCHNGNYNVTPNTCYGCHESNYNQTTNPPHASSGFSTDCISCHSQTAWTPATFDHDAQYFPIYSGSHNGQWTLCSDCHTNNSNYAEFTCLPCHPQAQTDPEHSDVGGYAYNSAACFACHPTGQGGGSFNHNNSNFPLTGAHLNTDCILCHANGYIGTTTICSDCHIGAYNQSTNPNHAALGIPIECATCHTTVPGWQPAIFPIHENYYPLTGAHAQISDNCAVCHNGNYITTPNTCVGCHQSNYNQTSNPDHAGIGIGTDCETCHTTNPNWQPATFPIHSNYYPLTGAHASITDCNLCHNGNYITTPNTCFGCHESDYNQTTNPPHQSAQFPTDCETCHTTTAWVPSTFDHDGQYFPIYSGSHNGQWSLCSECHINNSNYAEFTCLTCHTQSETDPEHSDVGGYSYNSDACYACHPNGEADGSFNHNNSNFPLTGAHINTDCILCHANGYIGTTTICSDCHIDAYNQTTNPNHTAIGIPLECETCHTTAPGWQPATFPIHGNYYPLTGAHTSISDCNLCHNGNYITTPNTCVGCHQSNYNQTSNPDHASIGIGTDCETCHTTNPGWQPATFAIHANYYPLTGAHTSITDCNLCHNGNYVTTPNTCFGCHESDYNQTSNPPHLSAQFPTDCETCHTTTAWVPSTFDHDGQYFPIYSGHHNGRWDLCSDCHFNPSNYAEFTCLTCHHQNNMDQEHNGVSGYQYNSDACYACHPTGGGGDKMRIRSKN